MELNNYTNKLSKRKHGIYYSIDALLSGLLLVGVIIMVLNVSNYETKVEQKSFTSQDVMNSLSELKILELNNSFVLSEIANGSITNTENTVLEQMGEYWALEMPDKATQLFVSVISDVLPEKTGTKFSIESDELFLKNITGENDLVVTHRMISGISKGNPLTGYSASAYLKKVRNKKTSSYTYFGGFVGQGNITKKLELPDDFNSSRLVSAEMKIETPGSFNLYINGVICAGPYVGGEGIVNLWNITSCGASFTNLTNNITLIFTSGINSSYVSGGFVSTTYTTDTLKESGVYGYKRYTFPEITGFINLYDSISVQGFMNNWTLNLSFYNDYETFFSLGNETIFIAPGSNVTQNIIISRTNLSLNPTEIPLRLGITNLSNISVIQDGLPADSILVTDVSGSMGDCGEYSSQELDYCNYEYRTCWWMWCWWNDAQCAYSGTCSDDECGTGSGTTQNHYVSTENDTTCLASKLDIAKDADHLFVEIILNDSPIHKIGLVDYSSRANNPTALTSVKAVLDNEIDTYTDGGGTCTCCGINRAKDMLLSSTNNRFMVVLSDGEPSYYCNSFSDYLGSYNWGGDGSGGSSSNADKTWAIDAGQEACNNNITVFTIGFGDSMTPEGHDVMKQIACNVSYYYNASNASELAEIYRNISDRVLIAANFTSQTVNLVGDYTTSKILEGSYFDMHFEPILSESSQNKMSLYFESETFDDCDYSVDIPGSLLIQDAYVTSFSSNHWTKDLIVNGVEVFNLTNYGNEYALLGDPFTIQVPSALLQSGTSNDISLRIGDTPYNNSNCSMSNSLIYSALINSSTHRTQTMEFSDGCIWSIESENGVINNVTIPTNYNGSKNCSYTSIAPLLYDPLDAYNLAALDLFESLDPDNNHKITVDLTSYDLEITLTVVSDVPYLWGPSIARTDVWN